MLTGVCSQQSKITTLQQSADDLLYTQQWQRQEYEQTLMDIAAKQSQVWMDYAFCLCR